MSVDRELVRRWRAGHQAARLRALQQDRLDGPPTPAVSFERAMELCDLCDFPADDRIREREVARVREAWAKLRAYAARRSS